MSLAGKYAAFIWPAYAVTAALFAWMIADTLARTARFRAAVRRRERVRQAESIIRAP